MRVVGVFAHFGLKELSFHLNHGIYLIKCLTCLSLSLSPSLSGLEQNSSEPESILEKRSTEQGPTTMTTSSRQDKVNSNTYPGAVGVAAIYRVLPAIPEEDTLSETSLNASESGVDLFEPDDSQIDEPDAYRALHLR